MGAAQGREFVLTLSCPDKPGIVYAVSSFLVQHSGNILASQQYGESPHGRFFMRVHFSVPPPGLALEFGDTQPVQSEERKGELALRVTPSNFFLDTAAR